MNVSQNTSYTFATKHLCGKGKNMSHQTFEYCEFHSEHEIELEKLLLLEYGWTEEHGVCLQNIVSEMLQKFH